MGGKAERAIGRVSEAGEIVWKCGIVTQVYWKGRMISHCKCDIVWALVSEISARRVMRSDVILQLSGQWFTTASRSPTHWCNRARQRSDLPLTHASSVLHNLLSHVAELQNDSFAFETSHFGHGNGESPQHCFEWMSFIVSIVSHL